jgi:hypothetical protein
MEFPITQSSPSSYNKSFLHLNTLLSSLLSDTLVLGCPLNFFFLHRWILLVTCSKISFIQQFDQDYQKEAYFSSKMALLICIQKCTVVSTRIFQIHRLDKQVWYHGPLNPPV